jgi:hypothetical protein
MSDKLRILVVDDEALVADYVADLSKRLGTRSSALQRRARRRWNIWSEAQSTSPFSTSG